MAKKGLIMLVCFFCVLIVPFSAFSGTCEATLKTVYPLGNGDFQLKVNNFGTSSCPTEDYWAIVGEQQVTADGIDQLFRAALTAASADKTVKILYMPSHTLGHNIVMRIEVLF